MSSSSQLFDFCAFSHFILDIMSYLRQVHQVSALGTTLHSVICHSLHMTPCSQ